MWNLIRMPEGCNIKCKRESDPECEIFPEMLGSRREAMAAEGNSMDVLFYGSAEKLEVMKIYDICSEDGTEKIVYISLQSETLARDPKHLTKKDIR
ncbi:MAG: hypothetical protein ACLR2O_02425 [Coprococcus sp.]